MQVGKKEGEETRISDKYKKLRIFLFLARKFSIKYIVGGFLCLSSSIQELEAPIMGEEVDKLMMWKYCTECELITPIVPVTVDTWSLSFAMFLHIIFHENQLTRRGSDRQENQILREPASRRGSDRQEIYILFREQMNTFLIKNCYSKIFLNFSSLNLVLFRPDAKCSHSLHQEHLTCFGKMDAVTTFKYSKLPVNLIFNRHPLS